ncbi:MAG: 1-(5-phosphoribosyl)-5-((5-phosphoribosylamino)methylideneamino)imidazole-4-carboxamide isomerase, partial [Chloroflexi bacterium]|nr:1-(5-phosphoribosyl)-5-((5-phosphoribosylamino)methylideneamino)imidazole-4-carboxamide isomerase [Chloroflexota bacterium]
GVRRFIYTDITRDGTLTSPNFSAVSDMVLRAEAAGGARVIASGGIAEIDHLRTLASIGAEGAIIGVAIYHGTLDLAAAIAELG